MHNALMETNFENSDKLVDEIKKIHDQFLRTIAKLTILQSEISSIREDLARLKEILKS
ncbi:hypothetical protein KKF34_16800 [Myxococcota bacterium]|nr:hypothetical protein [Myxococcota bacterium]MBU1498538.1 hypothetical protein [Myxococcota bacterium]